MHTSPSRQLIVPKQIAKDQDALERRLQQLHANESAENDKQKEDRNADADQAQGTLVAIPEKQGDQARAVLVVDDGYALGGMKSASGKGGSATKAGGAGEAASASPAREGASKTQKKAPGVKKSKAQQVRRGSLIVRVGDPIGLLSFAKLSPPNIFVAASE